MADRLPLRSLSLLLLAVLSTGCVSATRYDALVAKHDRLQTENTRLNGDLSAQLAFGLDADERRRALEADAAALNHVLRELSGERKVLGSLVDSTKAEARAAARAQRAAEARAETFRALALKLKRMTDAGSLSVSLRDGRMVLALPNDVLFESGSASLSKPGREVLAAVADALRSLPDRHFQVAGHTDDRPIQTATYPSNWELSAARAIQVVRLLLGEGVPASALSAAGYGEFDPVASNDAAATRAKNRRIEITLVPTISELVTVP